MGIQNISWKNFFPQIYIFYLELLDKMETKQKNLSKSKLLIQIITG